MSSQAPLPALDYSANTYLTYSGNPTVLQAALPNAPVEVQHLGAVGPDAMATSQIVCVPGIPSAEGVSEQANLVRIFSASVSLRS